MIWDNNSHTVFDVNVGNNITVVLSAFSSEPYASLCMCLHRNHIFDNSIFKDFQPFYSKLKYIVHFNEKAIVIQHGFHQGGSTIIRNLILNSNVYDFFYENCDFDVIVH